LGCSRSDLPDYRLRRSHNFISRESSITEKFEAMVKLGFLNSRMKDFYDIWLLSRQFRFEQATLAEAIRLTFEQRGTVLPSNIDAFSETFIDAKQSQWKAPEIQEIIEVRKCGVMTKKDNCNAGNKMVW
jgi:hypothetical protein